MPSSPAMSVRAPCPVAAVQQASCSTISAAFALVCALSCEMRPPGPVSVCAITCAQHRLCRIFRMRCVRLCTVLTSSAALWHLQVFYVLIPSSSCKHLISILAAGLCWWPAVQGALDAVKEVTHFVGHFKHVLHDVLACACHGAPSFAAVGSLTLICQLGSRAAPAERHAALQMLRPAGRTSLSLRMASCCWSWSQSRRARSRAAPGTPRASASSVAVPAASLCPLTRQSCACCSQHMPASASSPASTASCLRSARIGSCAPPAASVRTCLPHTSAFQASRARKAAQGNIVSLSGGVMKQAAPV